MKGERTVKEHVVLVEAEIPEQCLYTRFAWPDRLRSTSLCIPAVKP